MRRFGWLRATIGVGCCLLAVGCGSDAGSGTGSPVSRTAGAAASPTPSAGTAGAPVRYVALGDSYTAGPLIPYLDLGSGACARSSNNYPHVLARWLRARPVRDVSCSGATTRDLTAPQQTATGRVVAQLRAVTADTTLVTVGIGGNDAGLFGSIVATCRRIERTATRPDACRRSFTHHGVDTRLRAARATGAQVARAVAAIRGRAPHARIVVLGYPRIVAASRTCRVFSPADARWADRVESALNASIARAVRARGARFVDLYPSTAGTTCAQGGRPGSTAPVPTRCVRSHSTRSSPGC